jgi:hypothetical protein
MILRNDVDKFNYYPFTVGWWDAELHYYIYLDLEVFPNFFNEVLEKHSLSAGNGELWEDLFEIHLKRIFPKEISLFNFASYNDYVFITAPDGNLVLKAVYSLLHLINDSKKLESLMKYYKDNNLYYR